MIEKIADAIVFFCCLYSGKQMVVFVVPSLSDEWIMWVVVVIFASLGASRWANRYGT